MKIAICNENISTIEMLENQIEECSKKMGVRVETETFLTPERLVKSVLENRSFHIYILATGMQGISAAQLEQMIRLRNREALFIVVSNSMEQFTNHFDVCNILESYNPYLVRHVIYQAMERFMASKNMFLIKDRKGIYSFPADQIIYFRSNRRKMILCHMTGQIEYYGTIKDTIDKLDTRIFAQINKSDIINLCYVQQSDYKTVLLQTGEPLTLSPVYRNSFLQSFQEYVYLEKKISDQ